MLPASSARSQAAVQRPVRSSVGALAEPLRSALVWALSSFLMLLALLWPALWNGYPIVFYNTGGYLDSYMTGLPANGRSALYGLFLSLGIPSGFGIIILSQACLVAWLLILTLRVHGHGHRPWLSAGIAVTLGASTSLPWYAAELMPDVWLPAGVLAFYLLAFHRLDLRAAEKAALVAIVAFAIAGHMGTLGLITALVGPLLFWYAAAPRFRWPRPAVAMPAIAVAAGILLMLMSNLLLIGRFGFIPGGPNFLFGRLIQTGIAAQYLDEYCPDESLRICVWRAELPSEGDDWLWKETSPIWQLGGWEGFENEAERIVIDSLRAFPLQHIEAAIEGTLSQLIMVKTGDYLTPWSWHTRDKLRRYAPESYPAFDSARQQQADIDFTWVNAVHVPVALGSMGGLAVVVLLAWRGRWPRRRAALPLMLLVALLANAAICGALSNPHDRYQSRLVALAPLALIVAFLPRRERDAEENDDPSSPHINPAPSMNSGAPASPNEN